jgi:osmotically-inducible protein OsmY
LRDRVTDGWYRVRIVSAPDEVVLQGQVDNQRTRESVIAAARAAVSRPIRDDLKVQPLVTDQEIAAALKRALEQEYPGLATKVQISVNDAIVHLRGDLKNHRDVDRILAAAMGQKGVQDIQSDITVRGHAYPMSRR